MPRNILDAFVDGLDIGIDQRRRRRRWRRKPPLGDGLRLLATMVAVLAVLFLATA